MFRLAAALAMGLLAAGCVTDPNSQDLTSFDPRLLAQAPKAYLTLIDGGHHQWLVHAIVNGQEGLFEVDTASDATVISRDFADKIGVWDDSLPGDFAGPNQVGQEVRYAPITYLQLDKLLFLKFYAPILKLDHINRVMGKQIDGIIGNNILRKTVSTFDWHKKLLTLEIVRPAPPPPDSTPIALRYNRIFVTAKINGRNAELAIDTAAFRSSLTSADVGRLKIPSTAIGEYRASHVDISESRNIVQKEVAVDHLIIGKLDHIDFPMLIWDNSVLGMDVLESGVLKLDPTTGWMTLKPY